ncbi:metalloregulator ArsR/SmtB family transcription factor [Streptomyces lunalinharesii]|uniref:Helix-turn-helix domain-containing protein n=1 Tax=Streptomyces lunalinharesii TaxID=333384 RepID=A0ABN3RHL8_9ACTN
MRAPDHPQLSTVSLSDALGALADPTRRAVVRVLTDGREHLAGDFDLGVAQSTLSHHMKKLRQGGITHSRPDGTRCWVSLRPEFDERFPGLLRTVLGLDTEQARS